MTTELGLSTVNKEQAEHQSDDSKVEEPHAQYISAVVEAICRNQLATLKQWSLYLETLPRYKREAIWTTCKTLPSFSNFNRNSFAQTIQSWEENPVRNMSSISVLYTAICFLQAEGMLPEIPPKGEPNYEYNPSSTKDFQSPSRDSTIPPSKQQFVQQAPIPSYQIPPQPQMTQYIAPNYSAPPVYPQMQQQYMQNPQMHYQDPSQMHLPNVPMMQMQPMGMNPNGMQPPTLPMPGMYAQQNMNPYMMQQPAYSQQQMMAPPQTPPNMQGHALGACPGCRQVLKYPQAATIVRCPKCNTTLQPQQLQQQLQQQFPQHQVQMLHQQLQSGTLQVQSQQMMQPPYTQQNNSPRHVSTTPNSSKNNSKMNHSPYQQSMQPLQQMQPMQQMQHPQQMPPLQPPQQLPPPPQQGHSSVNSLLNTPVITPSSFMPMGNQNQMTVNPLNIPQGMKPMPSMSPNQILSPPDFGQKLPLPKPWNGTPQQRPFPDQSVPPSLSPILNPRQAVTHEIALEGTKMMHPKPLLEKEQFAKKLRPDFPPSPQASSQEQNTGYHPMETVNVPLGSSQDRPILLEEPSPMRMDLSDKVKEEYTNYEQNAQQPVNSQPEQQQEVPAQESEKDSMVQSFFAETSEATEVQQ